MVGRYIAVELALSVRLLHAKNKHGEEVEQLGLSYQPVFFIPLSTPLC